MSVATFGEFIIGEYEEGVAVTGIVSNWRIISWYHRKQGTEKYKDIVEYRPDQVKVNEKNTPANRWLQTKLRSAYLY